MVIDEFHDSPVTVPANSASYRAIRSNGVAPSRSTSAATTVSTSATAGVSASNGDGDATLVVKITSAWAASGDKYGSVKAISVAPCDFAIIDKRTVSCW